MRVLMLAVLCLCGCSEAPRAEVDGAVLGDAGLALDAAGMVGADAGAGDAGAGDDAAALPDAAVAPDAGAEALDGGVDAGASASPCVMGEVHDALRRLCYALLPWSSGPFCSSPYEPLKWEGRDDQLRIWGLLAVEGPGGTALVYNSGVSRWWWVDTRESPGGMQWATGHPRAAEQFTYIASDGLRTNPRAFSSQWCMRSAP